MKYLFLVLKVQEVNFDPLWFKMNCPTGCPCETFTCSESTTQSESSTTTTTITQTTSTTTTTSTITTTSAPLNAVLIFRSSYFKSYVVDMYDWFAYILWNNLKNPKMKRKAMPTFVFMRESLWIILNFSQLIKEMTEKVTQTLWRKCQRRG